MARRTRQQLRPVGAAPLEVAAQHQERVTGGDHGQSTDPTTGQTTATVKESLVQEQGRPSWQLRTQEHCRLATHALRVRDVCGLRIPASVDHPPRIEAVDDVVAGHLSAEERAQAGALWPAWWRSCLTAECVSQLPDGPLVEGVWREDLNQALGASGQAPDFEGLSQRPALQRAAQLTWRADHDRRAAGPGHPGDGSPGARRLGIGATDLPELTDPRRGSPAARPPAWGAWQQRTPEQRQQQWKATSAVAQQVMATYAVPASRVQAWLLQVPGMTSWWQLVRPGVVVATEAATADVQVLGALLWEGFTSRLGAAGE